MEWEIVQEGGGNCLKTVCDGRTDFADSIFFYQDVPGFLPFETRLINGKKESFYDITGKISLAGYLREGRFRLADIKDIFRQILDMEETLEQYLLEGAGLIIHEEFLYLDRGTGRLWGIYYGEASKGDMAAVGTLLEYIMDYMEQTDRELVFFIYGMHKLTRGAVCTRRDLAAYLGEKEEEIVLSKEQKAAPLPLSGMDKTPSSELSEKGDKKKQIPVLSATLLLLGMAIPVILWRAGIFTLPLSGGMDWGKCLAAAAFFLIVSGYGAWRAAGMNHRISRNMPHIPVREENSTWQLCLIPGKSGEELIPIRYYPFIIGSDEVRTDGLLRGSDVSGSHLQIVEEGGEIIAIDQESAGGTFHNDRRMVPWQKQPLKDGDILAVGSHEFVVELTSSEYVM